MVQSEGHQEEEVDSEDSSPEYDGDEDDLLRLLLECDTDDEDGKYPRCTNPKEAASATKLFLEEGKLRSDKEPIVTLEDGTCMVFDPNSDNGLIMDGDSNNANAIWLRNWREIGLDLAKKYRRLVHSGPRCWRAERNAEGGGEHGD